MRTIKFRGKRIDNGQWMYGYVLHCKKYTDIWSAEGKFDRGEVDPESVGQFTGEIDSKGREIYENDIVCVADLEHKKVGVIRYNLAHWDIDFGGGEARLLSFINRNGATMEVIGNIHDNPELLKGGAQ